MGDRCANARNDAPDHKLEQAEVIHAYSARLFQKASLDELKPGYGAIVRRGLEKIAAYRDSDGGLHLNSASCSHVGCHLRFNSFETCWDCPCHGSMFSVDGCPINAPAIGPLGEIKE